MVIDFAGCYVVEVICKYLFADLEPKPMVTRGRERREARRRIQEEEKAMLEAENEIKAHAEKAREELEKHKAENGTAEKSGVEKRKNAKKGAVNGEAKAKAH
jgi:hypothetical protein